MYEFILENLGERNQEGIVCKYFSFLGDFCDLPFIN